jgi:hypothetical protein
LIALGFLQDVKARLDPSPFLSPLGMVVVFWFCSRGIKRAQDDSVFFGALEWWLWLGVVAE